MLLHQGLHLHFSSAFTREAALIPFMAARSRLLETTVSDSSHRQRTRQRSLALILDYPLPRVREVHEDSEARHHRARHRDWVYNHHAATLLCLELWTTDDLAAGEGFYSLIHLCAMIGDD